MNMLNLTPRSRGRPASLMVLEYVRDLTLGDIQETYEPRGIKPIGLVQLRDRHHALARVLASGVSDFEAGAITGYGPSRISILRADPTFKELIAHYRGIVEEKFADVQDRLASVTLDAVAELQDRLEDNPQAFSHDQLMDLVKMGADRTGNGPASKNTTTVNVNIGLADRMKAARERVKAQRAASLELTATVVEDLIDGNLVGREGTYQPADRGDEGRAVLGPPALGGPGGR